MKDTLKDSTRTSKPICPHCFRPAEEPAGERGQEHLQNMLCGHCGKSFAVQTELVPVYTTYRKHPAPEATVGASERLTGESLTVAVFRSMVNSYYRNALEGAVIRSYGMMHTMRKTFLEILGSAAKMIESFPSWYNSHTTFDMVCPSLEEGIARAVKTTMESIVSDLLDFELDRYGISEHERHDERRHCLATVYENGDVNIKVCMGYEINGLEVLLDFDRTIPLTDFKDEKALEGLLMDIEDYTLSQFRAVLGGLGTAPELESRATGADTVENLLADDWIESVNDQDLVDRLRNNAASLLRPWDDNPELLHINTAHGLLKNLHRIDTQEKKEDVEWQLGRVFSYLVKRIAMLKLANSPYDASLINQEEKSHVTCSIMSNLTLLVEADLTVLVEDSERVYSYQIPFRETNWFKDEEFRKSLVNEILS